MTPSQRDAVLRAIQRSRAPIAAFSLGLIAIMDPRVRRLYGLEGGGASSFPTAACPLILHGLDGKVLPDQDYYQLQLDPSLQYIKENQRASFDFLAQVVGCALMAVGDALDKTGAYPVSREFQFLKQCRHAVAHGNKIHMKSAEKKAAYLSYEITPALNGQRLLRDADGDGLLQLGDALALLDHLEERLRTGVE